MTEAEPPHWIQAFQRSYYIQWTLFSSPLHTPTSPNRSGESIAVAMAHTIQRKSAGYTQLE